MAYYDLDKNERAAAALLTHTELLAATKAGREKEFLRYFSDEDTYIRKNGYLAAGRIYKGEETLRGKVLILLASLFESEDPKIRQTVINAAGEIGMWDFEPVSELMRKGLADEHHSVRNAVIGSIKKMGQKNPEPVLAFAREYLHHSDKEIRREICHGIELRGRTHPQDILPLLRELQHDPTARVRNTLVHVLGQIAYKKGCLATVVSDLNSWENKELVGEALLEIIDVHDRYSDFAVLSQQEAIDYISKHSVVEATASRKKNPPSSRKQ
jgi:HEAT repeat protein